MGYSVLMIFLFTDFGYQGPYVGQMHAVLAQAAPDVPAIDLMHDAPAFQPRLAGYLLASLIPNLPADAIICAVVDPGVGSDRAPLLVKADDRWLIGPDNGLLEIAARRAGNAERHVLTGMPERLSASFHGRDLFAPAAAVLALRETPECRPLDTRPAGADWPDDLCEIVYIDHYGNAMTGLRAEKLADRVLVAGGRRLPRVRTFSDCAPGEAFWYANSSGLAEIAVNRGSAADVFDLEIGSAIKVQG